VGPVELEVDGAPAVVPGILLAAWVVEDGIPEVRVIIRS
jgi:hypothetical protein